LLPWLAFTIDQV